MTTRRRFVVAFLAALFALTIPSSAQAANPCDPGRGMNTISRNIRASTADSNPGVQIYGLQATFDNTTLPDTDTAVQNVRIELNKYQGTDVRAFAALEWFPGQTSVHDTKIYWYVERERPGIGDQFNWLYFWNKVPIGSYTADTTPTLRIEIGGVAGGNNLEVFRVSVSQTDGTFRIVSSYTDAHLPGHYRSQNIVSGSYNDANQFHGVRSDHRDITSMRYDSNINDYWNQSYIVGATAYNLTSWMASRGGLDWLETWDEQPVCQND